MKTKFIFFFIVFVCCVGNIFGQTSNWLWAKSAGGTIYDESYSVSTDANGNVFVTGVFQCPSITFGTSTLTNADNTGNTYDIFIVKYDASGNVVWAKSAGGTGFDFGNSISTDANGNIFMTGTFSSTSITFGTTTLTNADTTGSNSDIFVAKYDMNGNVLWAKSAGGPGYDEDLGGATDASGNVFMTGDFESPSITFGTTTLTNAGNSDIFIVKYDASGNVLWAKRAGGTSTDDGYSCSTDDNGNVFMTGVFASQSLTFGTTTLMNAGNTYDFFIVKYDASGNVFWAKSAGGIYSDYGSSVSTDANGNVFVTGFFQSPTISFGTTTLTNADNTGSTADIFIVKYDVSGNVLWAKSAGETGDDDGRSISSDTNGNVILTGYFESTAILFGTTILNNGGGRNLFIVEYDASGNVLWAKNAVGTYNIGNSVATDANGNLFVTGGYGPSVTFGTTTLTTTAILGDMFIVKLGTIASLESFGNNEGISILPNPSNGIFTIKNNFPGIFEMKIFNSLGQEVFRREKINSTFFEVDLSNQPNGIYFVRVIEDGKIYSQKIIKK